MTYSINDKNFELFTFDDYRNALKWLISQRKNLSKPFSYRWFARQAGYTSPNFLKLVIDGKRDLSEESTEKVINIFKLSKQEGHFFRTLVLLNKTKSIEKKGELANQIIKMKGYSNMHPLGEAQFRYYSKWYHIPIRELINQGDFKNDPKRISQHIVPSISELEAKEALETLLSLDLIEQDSDGFLKAKHTNVSTANNVLKTSVGNYHKKMIQLGGEAIERFSKEEREVSSVSVSLSAESFKLVQELIVDLRKEIINLSEKDSNHDQIFQLNFQLYPISKKINRGQA